jgi:hypothetical protein
MRLYLYEMVHQEWHEKYHQLIIISKAFCNDEMDIIPSPFFSYMGIRPLCNLYVFT